MALSGLSPLCRPRGATTGKRAGKSSPAACPAPTALWGHKGDAATAVIFGVSGLILITDPWGCSGASRREGLEGLLPPQLPCGYGEVEGSLPQPQRGFFHHGSLLPSLSTG